ncbi:MAG: hypothetical protein WDM78_11485 [Puia sp.]
MVNLPTQIGKLKKLSQIGLGDLHELNWSRAFDILATLPKLERVGMYTMKIGKMPDGFGKLGQVKTFWLTYNSFNSEEKKRIEQMVPNAKVVFN